PEEPHADSVKAMIREPTLAGFLDMTCLDSIGSPSSLEGGCREDAHQQTGGWPVPTHGRKVRKYSFHSARVSAQIAVTIASPHLSDRPWCPRRGISHLRRAYGMAVSKPLVLATAPHRYCVVTVTTTVTSDSRANPLSAPPNSPRPARIRELDSLRGL